MVSIRSNNCAKSQKNWKSLINGYSWKGMLSMKYLRLGKMWKKIIQQLLLIYCILKRTCIYFKTFFEFWKMNGIFNDPKWRKIKLTLYFYKKPLALPPQWLLLFKLPSFFCKKKKIESHENICKEKAFCRIVLRTENNKT